MKKAILFLTSILFCQPASSQITPLENIVKISLPKGTEKLSPEKIHSASKAYSDFSQIKAKSLKKGTIYKSGSILIFLNGAFAYTPPNFLHDQKAGIHATQPLDPTSPPKYSTVINSINNYQVLIMTYTRGKSSWYKFYSVNNARNSILNGIIEFKPSDKGKAKLILETLLRSMKFKT